MIRSIAAIGLLAFAAAGCDRAQPPHSAPTPGEQVGPGPDERPPVTDPRTPAPPGQPDTPPAGTPGRDPAVLLPSLDGYRTDDSADAGELRSSLDHAGIAHRDVRRRLILDDQGFVAGEITMLTFEPGTGGADDYIRHRYGEAARVPIQIAGVQMMRIAASPHHALAWSGDGFVMTFQRGQERTDEWLEQVAAATVRAVERLERLPDEATPALP